MNIFLLYKIQYDPYGACHESLKSVHKTREGAEKEKKDYESKMKPMMGYNSWYEIHTNFLED